MKILVAGGAGFIGSAIVKRLESSGFDVYSYDKKGGNNLLDGNRLTRYVSLLRPDIVINAAGTCSTSLSIKHPENDLQDNVIGLFNLLETIRLVGSKLIHMSSCKVAHSDDGFYTPYGLTKRMGEMLVQEWKDLYKVKTIVNRLGTVYGPGQDGDEDKGWLGCFIKAKVNNQPVNVFGDGEQSRDVLYIDDLVDLIEYQAHNFDKYNNPTPYTVGGGVNNLICLNQVIARLDLKANYFPKRIGDNKNFLSPNAVSLRNDWKPKTLWTDGIDKTIKYLEEHA